MFVTEDGTSTEHSGQVFHYLVHILATLQEPKYENFQPVIEAYINDHFAAALVYKVGGENRFKDYKILTLLNISAVSLYYKLDSNVGFHYRMKKTSAVENDMKYDIS